MFHVGPSDGGGGDSGNMNQPVGVLDWGGGGGGRCRGAFLDQQRRRRGDILALSLLLLLGEL